MRAAFFLMALVFGSGLARAENELALVQYDADSHFGDYALNRSRLSRFAQEAVEQGAKIVVFPEGSLYGYGNDSASWCAPDRNEEGCHDVGAVAEQVPGGKSSQYWEAFARHYQIFVLINLPEKADGHYFNTTAVFGPRGFLGRYRKRHLFDADELYASPGDSGPFTFSTPFGSFGLLICMDANFPELFEDYKKLGVHQLIIPMDWDQDPLGRSGARPARLFFQQLANEEQLDIFVSDAARWDGTGSYFAKGGERERRGLSKIAIGREGISFHSFVNAPKRQASPSSDWRDSIFRN